MTHRRLLDLSNLIKKNFHPVWAAWRIRSDSAWMSVSQGLNRSMRRLMRSDQNKQYGGSVATPSQPALASRTKVLSRWSSKRISNAFSSIGNSVFLAVGLISGWLLVSSKIMYDNASNEGISVAKCTLVSYILIGWQRRKVSESANEVSHYHFRKF